MIDFNDSKKMHMPGYTGHVPDDYLEDSTNQNRQTKKHIPGYGGYVPAIKSENLYGKTFGKCTQQSSTGEYDKGIDLSAEKKFKSTLQKEFVDQGRVHKETAAETLGGVDKKPDMYKRPIDPSIMNKFWGTGDRDEVVDQVHFERNKKTFYGVGNKPGQATQKRQIQEKEEAIKEFFGLPEKKEQEHVLPIPGYSGVSRRVAADNVFGMTYAEARRCADDSLKKINEEKGETLHENSKFVPEYNRAGPEDEFF